MVYDRCCKAAMRFKRMPEQPFFALTKTEGERRKKFFFTNSSEIEIENSKTKQEVI